jgi:glucokinase
VTAPVLAVDIGGTKLAAALVAVDGSVSRRAETPTPPSGADEIAAALVALVTAVIADEHPSAVGIACAGPLDVHAGTASPVNIASWRDFPVVKLLRDVVGEIPVALVGDVSALAIGEHWRGAGQGARALLGIVVSTGIGGGLVLNGLPYTGPSGNAGHIGHMSVDLTGPSCPCGGRGCVEIYASGPSMARWAIAQGWVGRDARDLAESARSGEAIACAAFDRTARVLAQAIVTTAAICDLDGVVIGGGVAQAGEVLFAPLRRHVAEQTTLDFTRRLTVAAAALGRDAGLVGAARYALLS